jgi:putative nucleotidyltransferase with HDIG domain
MSKKPNYKKIYGFIKSKFNKTEYFSHGPFDETFYSLLVYQTAKELINNIVDTQVREDIVLTAALMHDIGKTKLDTTKIFDKNGFIKNSSLEWHRHEKLSANIAKKYLTKEGFSKEFIEEVCYLIENHDKRKESNLSIELKILQDADILADIGFAGFIRPFLYSGMFKPQSVLDSIRFIEKEDRTESGLILNLAISRKMAKKKMKLQIKLAGLLKEEINNDLFEE